MHKIKNILTLLLLLVVIPAVILIGGLIFKEKYYAFISLCVATASCIPLFYCFERKESTSKELTVLAVIIALSAIGRFIFAWLPAFKPITAITVITGVYLGKESGFMVGALSALVSNFYFGQGPWTPFQMLAWGLIGFLAGVLSKPLSKHKIALCLFGFFAGVFYSATMDIWTVLWADNTFNLSRYIAAAITALPVTIEYAVSNIIFILLLAKPFGRKLERLKNKYGLFI